MVHKRYAMNIHKFNFFLLHKLPAAFFTGVRLRSINMNACEVTVKHRWINQNPFKSMFWAVQGMAAELSTGALVISKIKQSKKPVSMLVISNQSKFYKKATGRITFICEQGLLVDKTLQEVLQSDAGHCVTLKAHGYDETGALVSSFDFEWSLRKKK